MAAFDSPCLREACSSIIKDWADVNRWLSDQFNRVTIANDTNLIEASASNLSRRLRHHQS